MRALAIAALVVVSGCNPTEEAKASSAEVKKEEVKLVEVPEALADGPSNYVEKPAEVVEPPKPKPKPLTEGRCRRLMKKFDQCGWRCVHRGGGMGRCVNACRPALNRTGMRCLSLWGPGFG